MAQCTIDLGLLPDLSGILQFDASKITICNLIEDGVAFVNPLIGVMNDGITSINNSVAIINTELATITTVNIQLDTWISTPPSGWTEQDIQDVRDELGLKGTCANGRKTSSNTLSAKIDTNFRGHTDILSGVDLTPSAGVPNLFARSGLEDSLNITRKQFNTPIVSETANMFGSIFSGEDLLTDVKLETDKLPVGSVVGLDIVNIISGGTAASNKTALINDISNLTCLPASTLTNFVNDIQGLIDGDEETYLSLANELLDCLGALSVDAWFRNPFKLQLLNCIASVALKAAASL